MTIFTSLSRDVATILCRTPPFLDDIVMSLLTMSWRCRSERGARDKRAWGEGGKGKGKEQSAGAADCSQHSREACEKAPACRGALVTPLWRSRNAVRDGHVTVVQRKKWRC